MTLLPGDFSASNAVWLQLSLRNLVREATGGATWVLLLGFGSMRGGPEDPTFFWTLGGICVVAIGCILALTRPNPRSLMVIGITYIGSTLLFVAGEVFYGRGFFPPFESLAAVFAGVSTLNTYVKIRPLLPSVHGSLEKAHAKRLKSLVEQISKEDPKANPSIIEGSNSPIRLWVEGDEVLVADAKASRCMSVSLFDAAGWIKNIEAKRLKMVIPHPMEKINVTFTKFYSDRLKAHLGMVPPEKPPVEESAADENSNEWDDPDAY